MGSRKTACLNVALVFTLWLATASAATAQSFTVLANFNSNNGSQPEASLVQGPDGNLYGTTYYGGANAIGDCQPVGCGTVFRVTPDGQLTTLYSFCARRNCADGYEPVGALALGTDGNFYGTTASGIDSGFSTVFRITPGGKLKTLYNFCNQDCADGSQATGGLVQGSDGNFYGTTGGGGVYNTQCPSGCGTVFKITPQGVLTTLYSFTGATDGGSPVAGLILGNDGNFYGTTNQGGAIHNPQCASYGCGTVFKITADGVLTTIFRFTGVNGLFPEAPLVQASDGTFYGTTDYGGSGSGLYGTVFRATSTDQLKTLYDFCTLYNCADGANPTAGLVQATDGNFYGTTSGADYFGSVPGTIFRMTPHGRLATIHTFCARTNCADGYAPFAGLLQATDGNLYGTADGGGTSTNCSGGCGTVFRLSVDLPPFVSFVRSFGKVGQTVEILGQGFTETTGVSFNGTPATFTVSQDTFLTATVPAGATTGPVTVTTPSGTLRSNVPFRVMP